MNRVLLARLEALLRRDADVRTRLRDEGRLFGHYALEMQQVHVDNAEALARIIDEHGWPGKKTVGKRGGEVAWTIAQHAICTPTLQREFLRALKTAVDAGDAPAQHAARLDDRIRFHEGRPQLYGTVLDWCDDGQLGCEVDDPDGVDARRKAVGLPAFGKALGQQRRAALAEGGAPPKDLQAYRGEQHAWAIAVGWRSAQSD